jgi:hypothetical protein
LEVKVEVCKSTFFHPHQRKKCKKVSNYLQERRNDIIFAVQKLKLHFADRGWHSICSGSFAIIPLPLQVQNDSSKGVDWI